ncbi:MAG: ornithine carbamoyltransferase [Armatimonadetes bacterium]|nr:ornithine carbamoyltransferase [Armatimonadota bacterium]
MAFSNVLKQLETVVGDFRAALATPVEEGAFEVPDLLRGSSLVSIADLSRSELGLVFTTAARLKKMLKAKPPILPRPLARKTLAMVFEKPSLRTRVSFETGMTQLGGHAINLQPAEIQLGQRESIADAARALGRMVDGIMARTFSHHTVVELARHAGVPVINGLSDREHPCQALADFMTILEKRNEVKGLEVAWVGDGNNVCHSNLLVAAKLGAHFTIACPEGHDPDPEIVALAEEDAKESGAQIRVTHDPLEAVSGARAIITDVWASMGQESEAAERARTFAPFQVNGDLVGLAAPDCVVLHCLPAHRGEEITDGVIDGPHSVVFDQAENRLHAQKGLLVLLLG